MNPRRLLMRRKSKALSTPLAAAMAVVFATTLATLPSRVDASVISVSSLLSSGTYVSTSVTSGFDISSQLAGNSVVSGSVTAYFYDNSDPWYVVSSDSGSIFDAYTTYLDGRYYPCGSSLCYETVYYTDFYYHNDLTNQYLDPSEVAELSVGSSLGSSGSSWFDYGRQYDRSINYTSWYGYGYNHYEYRYYTQFSGYSGSFSVTMGLDAQALADINADGLLSFGIRSNAGDFMVNSVRLDATLAPNAQRVPEPGALALVGIALGGLAWSARRSRSKGRPIA